MPFISGEHGNKSQSLKLKGTGEQSRFWGTGSIENKDFDFGEQGKMPIFQGKIKILILGNKGKCRFFRGTREHVLSPHPWEGLRYIWSYKRN